jgi:iodotyrosine deiodinase
MGPTFQPLDWYSEVSPEEMKRRARSFFEAASRRRTVRHFSKRPVPADVVLDCIRTAGTAPSGANLQPWHFVVVGDKAKRSELRVAAEKEEREFYDNRAPAEWLEALEKIGTDSSKPFLEDAPILIAVFVQRYTERPDGTQVKHYYATESVGIATGMLIMALHHAGLVSLTHTPSPMRFLNEVLERPQSERPFLLLAAGYPASDAVVPALTRKADDEFISII